jgi:hypothetical protein
MLSRDQLSAISYWLTRIVKAKVFNVNFGKVNMIDVSSLVLTSKTDITSALKIVSTQYTASEYKTFLSLMNSAYKKLEKAYELIEDDNPQEYQLYLVMDRVEWLLLLLEDEELNVDAELQCFNVENIKMMRG